MKLNEERAEGLYQFTGHGPGYVEVNGERLTASVMVGGSLIDRNWAPVPTGVLSSDTAAELALRKIEVVLIGTGSQLRFPPRGTLACLTSAGIGYEVMDTPAACRTYNVLLSEGRRVIAALVVD